MKTTTIVGILLIVLGVVSLAFQGITYNTQKNVIKLGPIKPRKKRKSEFLCLRF